jgi:hypothetical protein
MENVVTRLVALIEKFLLPLVLVVGFLLYQKFSSFFGNREKEEEAEKEEVKTHNNALEPSYKPVPKTGTQKEREKVIFENEAKAKLFKQAMAAEKLKPLLSHSIFNLQRVSELFAVADYMKKYRISLTATAEQYKKLTSREFLGADDLYSDLRYSLGSKYPAWLAIAGTTK